jgi:hypothetical protein
MVGPDRDRLTGEIEVDETYVGGPEEGKRGRESENKSLSWSRQRNTVEQSVISD